MRDVPWYTGTYLEMFCELGMYLGTQVYKKYSVRDVPWYTGTYLEIVCEECTLVHSYIPRNVLWHIPVAFLGIPAQVYLEMPQVCTLCSLMPL